MIKVTVFQNMIHFCKLKIENASKHYTDTVADRERQRKLLI